MKKYKSYLIIILSIIIISIITGFIYGTNNNYDLTGYLGNLSTNNNLFSYHLIFIVLSFIMTISLVGIVGIGVLIGFESISIGYILSVFYQNYKMNGLLFGLANIGINKLLYLIVLIYLFIISIIFLKKSINNISGANKDYYAAIIIPLLKKYTVITIILMLYDIFVYFFGNIFLNNLTSML